MITLISTFRVLYLGRIDSIICFRTDRYGFHEGSKEKGKVHVMSGSSSIVYSCSFRKGTMDHVSTSVRSRRLISHRTTTDSEQRLDKRLMR